MSSSTLDCVCTVRLGGFSAVVWREEPCSACLRSQRAGARGLSAITVCHYSVRTLLSPHYPRPSMWSGARSLGSTPETILLFPSKMEAH